MDHVPARIVGEGPLLQRRRADQGVGVVDREVAGQDTEPVPAIAGPDITVCTRDTHIEEATIRGLAGVRDQCALEQIAAFVQRGDLEPGHDGFREATIVLAWRSGAHRIKQHGSLDDGAGRAQRGIWIDDLADDQTICIALDDRTCRVLNSPLLYEPGKTGRLLGATAETVGEYPDVGVRVFVQPGFCFSDELQVHVLDARLVTPSVHRIDRSTHATLRAGPLDVTSTDGRVAKPSRGRFWIAADLFIDLGDIGELVRIPLTVAGAVEGRNEQTLLRPAFIQQDWRSEIRESALGPVEARKLFSAGNGRVHAIRLPISAHPPPPCGSDQYVRLQARTGSLL